MRPLLINHLLRRSKGQTDGAKRMGGLSEVIAGAGQKELSSL
jgi:hypothetical protein